MKRIKNFTLGILGVTFLSLGLYACSNDNETEDVTSELNNFTAKKEVQNFNFIQDTIYKYKNGIEIKSIIKSTFPITKFTTEMEIEKNLISGHKVEIEMADSNGLVTFNVKYPNNQICSTCKRDKDGNISDSLECSTFGVNQCAFSTYQQWSDAKIILKSFTGGVQEVLVDCIARNCIGW